VSQARGGSWVLMAFCLETPSSITLDIRIASVYHFLCMAFSLETEEKCGIILVMSQELKQSRNPCLIYLDVTKLKNFSYRKLLFMNNVIS
jgi:hypothetical protein